MAIIPSDEKIFMVDRRTNTVYGGSQALQDMQQWYTMDDVRASSNTVPVEDLPLNEIVQISNIGDYEKTYAIRYSPAINGQVPFFVLQADEAGGSGLVEISYSLASTPGNTWASSILLFLLEGFGVGVYDQFYTTGLATTIDYGVDPVNQIGVNDEYLIIDTTDIITAIVKITGPYSFVKMVSFTD